MSQTQLARRCGIPRSHLARLEAGKVDFQLATLKRVLDAMFCDLVILPSARKRPSDALAERDLEKPFSRNPWAP
ncbi:MAG: helix-turn-helix transcriptional regulator [Elusimicrobia bacterium]|nr:helix-turn-helix transcriptional regulator [Elusimicrobiota bacterium]